MVDTSFSLPQSGVQNLLVWHQGALGDLLLAGPALAAVSRHYPQARITALGHPERWELLTGSLPVEWVWDSNEARWAPLFMDTALPPDLNQRLENFQLALVFSPEPQPILLDRLRQAGIPAVRWIPSFSDTACEPVRVLQARYLSRWGLPMVPQSFRLRVKKSWKESLPEFPGPGPWLAVAPGSGHPCKNWPLSHFYEVSRTLAWQEKLGVIWLAGPAEEKLLPYLRALAAAQGHVLLARQPLTRVAAALARCRLYLGNDSGLTHLAAAVGVPGVLALFGPTDPRIWAPPVEHVLTLSGPCPQVPCAQGRRISCLEPTCLQGLTPARVLEAVVSLLAQPDGLVSPRWKGQSAE